MKIRHSLFFEIYLGFLGVVVISAVAMGMAAHHLHGGPPPEVVAVGAGPPRHLVGLFIISVILAMGAWPVARFITHRLENLRRGVQTLGEGDLSARVRVQGRDEVADLARSFNRAADRIEALVTSQREMLAAASHELRSPLARMRLAIELLGETEDAEQRALHKAEAVRDIEELDQLVEELLLVGRLEASGPLTTTPLDLLALAAEEAARVGASVTGEPTTIAGDESLLRVALRNLLDNAGRHGAPPVTIAVTPTDGGALVVVQDAGPGVPSSERARVFEPFYRPQGHGAEPSQGTGLGLAIVARVAARHGGGARCEDGARFVLELPG